MRQAYLILGLAFLTAGLSLSQPVAPRKNTPPPGPKKAVSKSAKTPVRKASAVKVTAKGKKSSLPKTPARVRQLAPTQDRYREIQSALAARGFLQQEPTGVWDAQSSEALRQFQTETNLSPTGKLSSLTIIGLGLGPKFSDPPVMPPPVDTVDASAQSQSAQN